MQRWEDRQGPASDTDGLTGDRPERGQKTPGGWVSCKTEHQGLPGRPTVETEAEHTHPHTLTHHHNKARRGGRLWATAASAPSCHWLQPPGGIPAPAGRGRDTRCKKTRGFFSQATHVKMLRMCCSIQGLVFFLSSFLILDTPAPAGQRGDGEGSSRVDGCGCHPAAAKFGCGGPAPGLVSGGSTGRGRYEKKGPVWDWACVCVCVSRAGDTQIAQPTDAVPRQLSDDARGYTDARFMCVLVLSSKLQQQRLCVLCAG